MTLVDVPEALNLADWLLEARVREGLGAETAILARDGAVTYAQLASLTHRFGHLLRDLGVEPEQRVIVGLPDVPEFAGALLGTIAIGGVGVMVNALLKPDELRYFYDYTRAKVAVVHAEHLPAFDEAAGSAKYLEHLVVVGDPAAATARHHVAFDGAGAVEPLEYFESHRDDAALWLFSGGTTGRPKGVVQSHRSFVNTTVLYGQRVLGLRRGDRTLSVPKLYFGYATGSNLFFPLSVGATSVLFPERCTAEALFDQIALHRPTVLINVPTMIQKMVAHEAAKEQDLSCLRLATSAGEALPVELYDRWKRTFGVELLDGLGTAEMWHVFVTNRLGDVRPGSLGRVVEGFDLRVRDDDGQDLGAGEVGWLWVRGGARAIGYWQHQEKNESAFRGEWYVSGDMISRDADGYVTYHGRGDDMLKVGGKWLAPSDVENCLLRHPRVRECVVVGVVDGDGLTKPHAFVVAEGDTTSLDAELKAWVRRELEPYKAPREVTFLEALPRTHLGKVDRGRLRATS